MFVVDHFHSATWRLWDTSNLKRCLFTTLSESLIINDLTTLSTRTQSAAAQNGAALALHGAKTCGCPWLSHGNTRFQCSSAHARASNLQVMAAIFVHYCPICDFTTSTLIQWFSHDRSAHSNDPSFCVTCGINGCKRTYSIFSSLNSHVYRNHKERTCGSNSGQSLSERHSITVWPI